MNNSINLNN